MSNALGNFVNTYTALSANGRANDQNDRAERVTESNLKLNDQRIRKAKADNDDSDFRTWGAGVKGRIDAGGSLAPEDLDKIFKRMGVNDLSAFMRDDYATNFDIAGKAFTGEIDPNSKPVLTAANSMWGGVIKKAVGQKSAGGLEIVDQKIIGMAPSSDRQGVMFELANQTSDGKWHAAPMTEKRSTDQKNDPYVKVIPYETMMEQVQGQRLLHKIRNEKQVRGAFDGLLSAAAPKRTSNTLTVSDRMMLNEQRHKLNMEADVASDERRGVRDDKKNALALTKQQNTAINKLVTNMAKNRDERMSMGDPDYEYMDDETMLAVATNQVDPSLLNSSQRQLLSSRTQKREHEAKRAVIERKREEMNSNFFPGMPSNDEVVAELRKDPNFNGVDWSSFVSSPQSNLGQSQDQPAQQSAQTQQPAQTQQQTQKAPPQAEAMLKQNPQMKELFLQKYGYLPQGL